MKYSFHPEAEKEFIDAINYYNDCRENLGVEFAREVFHSIQNIILFPNAWSPFSKNTRRYIINRFPYGIVYRIKADEIVINAVMQLHRKPGYWEERVDNT